MFKKILVPMDGSKFSQRAFDYAHEIADQFNASLELIRVVHPVTPSSINEGTFPTRGSTEAATLSVEAAIGQEAKAVERAKKYLRTKANSGKCNGITCTYHVFVGNPADIIIGMAKKEKADLIIMSSHGLGGIKRAILGSVTDEVLRKSKKNVLVIHPGTK